MRRLTCVCRQPPLRLACMPHPSASARACTTGEGSTHAHAHTLPRVVILTHERPLRKRCRQRRDGCRGASAQAGHGVRGTGSHKRPRRACGAEHGAAPASAPWLGCLTSRPRGSPTCRWPSRATAGNSGRGAVDLRAPWLGLARLAHRTSKTAAVVSGADLVRGRRQQAVDVGALRKPRAAPKAAQAPHAALQRTDHRPEDAQAHG